MKSLIKEIKGRVVCDYIENDFFDVTRMKSLCMKKKLLIIPMRVKKIKE